MGHTYAHQTLEQSELTLNSILALIVEGIWDWDATTGRVTRSPGWYHMLGYDVGCFKEDVFTWENIIHPDDYANVMMHFESYITGKSDIYRIEYQCKKSDGSYLWIVDHGKIISRNSDGSVARMIGSHHNIHQQKMAQLGLVKQNALLKEGNFTLENIMKEKVEELQLKNRALEKKIIEVESISNLDSLTKIANRNQFEKELGKEVLRANRYNNKLSLAIFDIDNFKEVNDQHGHKVGDNVLCNIAQVVAENIRDVDLLARWGGDEFVMIFPELPQKVAHTACDKLRVLINKNAVIKELSVTCSFGVSEFQAGETLDDLFQRVDRLLFQSKTKGKNSVHS